MQREEAVVVVCQLLFLVLQREVQVVSGGGHRVQVRLQVGHLRCQRFDLRSLVLCLGVVGRDLGLEIVFLALVAMDRSGGSGCQGRQARCLGDRPTFLICFRLFFHGRDPLQRHLGGVHLVAQVSQCGLAGV